jgi:hypothetical protein
MDVVLMWHPQRGHLFYCKCPGLVRCRTEATEVCNTSWSRLLCLEVDVVGRRGFVVVASWSWCSILYCRILGLTAVVCTEPHEKEGEGIIYIYI